MTSPIFLGSPRRDLTRRPSKLIHYWRSADAFLDPITQEPRVYTRASLGWSVDDNGGIYSHANDQPRYESRIVNTVRGLGLLLEPTRVNLCLRSSDFGTTWTPTGTPTRAAAAKTVGSVVLDLIGDDDTGATTEGYNQTIAFTSTAVKSIGVLVAKGLNPGASGSLIQLRDNTASVNRLSATLTWSGTTPVLVMAAGSYLGAQALGSTGVYLLRFRTATVTHTNTNVLSIFPATGTGGGGGSFSANTRRSADMVMRVPVGSIGSSSAADRRQAAQVYRGPVGAAGSSGSGDLYAGGVLAEDNVGAPGTPIPTVGATVTVAEDDLSFTITTKPRALTWYGKFIEQGTLLRSGPVMSFGDGINPQFTVKSNGTYYGVEHHNGVALVTSYFSGGVMPVYGDVVEARAVLRADGSVYLGLSINGAAEIVSTPSGANTLASAWGANTLAVGRSAATGGQALWFESKLSGNEKTMTQMQGLF